MTWELPGFKADCPRCGHEMRLVPYSSKTDNGIKVVDAMCPNCLHVENVSFVIARKGEPDGLC